MSESSQKKLGLVEIMPMSVLHNEQQALTELTGEGWKVTKGPALLEPDVPGLEERRLWDYLITRSVQ